MKTPLLLASAILTVLPAFGQSLASVFDVPSTFDVSRTVRVSGTISKVAFFNPHVTFSVDVLNNDGTVTRWEVETASPNALMRNGVTRDVFARGATIVVEDAYPAKDGSPKANGRTLIFADGREFRWGPWERDLWNPNRDAQSTCESIPSRTEICITGAPPAK